MSENPNRSWWRGCLRGIGDGAVTGFVVGGIIALTAVLIAGTLWAAPGAWFGSIGLGAVASFLEGGLLGAIPGAVIGGMYESMTEYAHEHEIQKQIAEVRKIERNSDIADIMHPLPPVPDTPAITATERLTNRRLEQANKNHELA
jgi:hypothetical protein